MKSSAPADAASRRPLPEAKGPDAGINLTAQLLRDRGIFEEARRHNWYPEQVCPCAFPWHPSHALPACCPCALLQRTTCRSTHRNLPAPHSLPSTCRGKRQPRADWRAKLSHEPRRTARDPHPRPTPRIPTSLGAQPPRVGTYLPRYLGEWVTGGGNLSPHRTDGVQRVVCPSTLADGRPTADLPCLGYLGGWCAARSAIPTCAREHRPGGCWGMAPPPPTLC